MLLYTCNDILEANATRGKLKVQGIDPFNEEENKAGLNPVGGVKVKIFSNDTEAAEKIFNG